MKEQINEYNIWISNHLTPMPLSKLRRERKAYYLLSPFNSNIASVCISLDCHFLEGRHCVLLSSLISVLTTGPDTQCSIIFNELMKDRRNK